MRQFFSLVYKYRTFLLFIALEMLSLWLIFNQNNYQHYTFLSSSGKLIAGFDAATADAQHYLALKDLNQALLTENANLKRILTLAQPEQKTLIPVLDTPYCFVPARVINNSVYRTNNYLTIDRGTAHGIRSGMGIISATGIIGQVKNCSANFSTVYSALHSKLLISAKLKPNGTLGTVKWQTGKPKNGRMKYIPRDVQVNQGDTIVTSGFNSVFPENIVIGLVEKVEKKESESFLNIHFRYTSDFSTLTYVYVVDYQRKAERKTLEQTAD